MLLSLHHLLKHVQFNVAKRQNTTPVTVTLLSHQHMDLAGYYLSQQVTLNRSDSDFLKISSTELLKGQNIVIF